MDPRLCEAVVEAIDPNRDGLQEEPEDAQLEAGLAAAEQCLAKGHVLGLHSKAYMLRRLNRLDEARKLVKQAIAAGGPGKAAAYRALCQIEGDSDVALAKIACSAAISEAPDWAGGYLALANLELLQGRKAEAVILLDQALAHAPEDSSILLKKGTTLDQLDRMPEARDALLLAQKFAPDSWQTNLRLGDVLRQFKQYEQARRKLDRSLAIKPTADAYVYRGWLNDETGKYEAALADFANGIKLAPTWPLAYQRRGLAHREARRYRQGIADLTEAIRLRPDYAQYYVDRGLTHRRTRDAQAALKDYLQAVDLDSNNFRALGNIAELHLAVGNYDTAVVAADLALQVNPNYFVALNNRAYAYYHLKEFTKALDDYNRALLLNPTSQPSLFWRARTHTELEHYEAAVADYTTLVGINPQYAWAWMNRAALLIRAMKWTEAYADADRVLMAHFKNDPHAWETWAMAGIIGSKEGPAGLRERLDLFWPQVPEHEGKYFARALIGLVQSRFYPGSNLRAAALADLDKARSINPENKSIKTIDRILAEEKRLRLEYENEELRAELKRLKEGDRPHIGGDDYDDDFAY